MRFTEETLEPFGERLLTLEVESRLRYKMPTVLRLSRVLQERKCVRPSMKALAELCLDEALTNAIVHGNGRDPQRKVRVWLFCDDERWGAIVEDEGEGFAPEDVPQVDEGSPAEYARRGILLMDGYVDELLYSNGGRRVMLIRHREKEEGPPAPAEEAPPAAAPEAEAAAAYTAEEFPSVLELEDATFGTITKVTKDGDIAIVEVTDKRLSGANVAVLREEVGAAIADSKSLVMDMRNVEYISSVVLGALAAFSKVLQPRGGRLKVCRAQPVVEGVLRSVRLDLLVDPQPTKAAALAKLRHETGSA
ncbi:MAG: ATP-binding protein [Planctomycetota bacterium]|jgi:serine/threonine-protein kinase RsbW